jgi:RNA polymerase sigma-70 factor (ECF subfamily)
MLDDVVQEVFVVIHNKLNTLENPAAVRSWIYGIVRRTASDHRRKLRPDMNGEPISPDHPIEDPNGRSPADLAEQSDDVRRLWKLLDSLDAPKRELFIMAELQEFTCPEIASALEIPLNTAYSRLRAAREAFEAAMVRDTAQQRGCA